MVCIERSFIERWCHLTRLKQVQLPLSNFSFLSLPSRWYHYYKNHNFREWYTKLILCFISSHLWKHLGTVMMMMTFSLIGLGIIVMYGWLLPGLSIESPWMAWFHGIYFSYILLLIFFNYIMTIITCPGYTGGKILADEETKYQMNRLVPIDERHVKCYKCHELKLYRAHHCSVCGKCVLKMDHHCFWVNNCVGLYNHRYFFLFLIWLAWGCSYYTSISGYVLWESKVSEFPSCV
jgi:hypothetical protein